MTELISGSHHCPHHPTPRPSWSQDIPTTMSYHASPTRPGRDKTTPRGHPNYPVLGCYAPIAPATRAFRWSLQRSTR